MIKRLLIIGVMLLLILIAFLLGEMRKADTHQLYSVKKVIENYIELKSNFPKSKEDLINSGVLKIKTSNHNDIAYEVSFKYDYDHVVVWRKVNFDSFIIYYEMDPCSIILDDSRLINKHTKETIHLVKGNGFHFIGSKSYDQVSVELYEILMDSQGGR